MSDYSETQKVLEAQLLAVIQQKQQFETENEAAQLKYNDVEEAQRKLEEEKAAALAQFEKKARKIYEDRNKAYEKIHSTKININSTEQQIAALKKQLQDVKDQASSQEQLAKVSQMLIDEFGDRKWWKAATAYQREDIVFYCSAFLSDKNGVLNANVMGSGKTLEQAANIEIQTWLFAQRYANLDRLPRILWVTKKNLLGSSHAELRKWNDQNLFMYIQGTAAEREAKIRTALDFHAVVIVNYDMLNTTPILTETEWDFVFIDEVHQLKGGANPGGPTARFNNMRSLLGIQEGANKYVWSRTRSTLNADGEYTKQLPFVSMLSATPVQNRPEEVWCWLHLFEPQIFPDLNQFIRNFTDYYGAFNPNKMLETLQGRFIRQDPQLIYASRPDKDRMIVEVEMTNAQREVFQNALDFVLGSFDKEPDAKVNLTAMIAKLTRCRQISLWPPAVNIVDKDTGMDYGRINVHESGKIDAAMELIEGFLSDNEPVVVWTAQFNAPLEVLYERVTALGKTAAYITGATKNPQDVEKAFQQGEIDVLLCNMKAAGEGYNFNKAPDTWPGGSSNAIFLDHWYNPQVNNQAEDRIWRTGAVQGCKIWVLYDPNSIDAFIEHLCDEKQKMFDDLIEQESLAPSNFDWKNLLVDLVVHGKKGDE